MIVKKLDKPGYLIKPGISQRLKSGFVVLKPGEEVGEHVTNKREEIIIILEGKATVVSGAEEQIVYKNHIIFIPENKKHNIVNKSNQILKYIYIVTRI